MKKVFIALMMFGFLMSVNAGEIKYYASTTTLVKEMGEKGDVSSSFFYVPAVVVSAVIESVAVPPLLFWNIFQTEGYSSK